MYKTIEKEEFPELEKLSFKDRCEYTTLRCGIGYANYKIAWCEEAIALLKSDSD
ncbi:MAG: hypothetical protein ACRC8K_24300 [Waterburya sp.]